MEPTMSFFSGFQPSDLLYLAEAAWRTVLISVLSISIGTFLGAIFGWMGQSFTTLVHKTGTARNPTHRFK